MEDLVIDDIIRKQSPNQCAMLMYTVSGVLATINMNFAASVDHNYKKSLIIT